MNPPDDSLLKIVIDHAWEAVLAVGTLLVTMARMIWVQNDKMIRANAESNTTALLEHKATSEKAMTEHKALNERMHNESRSELSIHRQHIAKLFDNAERSREHLALQLIEMRTDTNDRLMAISETQANQHVALLTAIHQVANAKKDK